jgi:E3 ubiquitin-protein ligase synoviolin
MQPAALHLVRDLYMTFRNFRRRVNEFIRYRRVTANLNERFPDSTPEELASGGALHVESS